MTYRRRFAATASLLLLVASPASAWPFGKGQAAKAPPPSGAPAASAKGDGKTGPSAPPAPRKATSEERAQADRLEPLGRAAFWARESDIDPRDAEAGLKLAQSLRAIGRNDEAAAAADHVLILHPDSVEAMLELGRAHIARGQGFYAVEPLERAAAVAPKDWRPLSLLGVALDQVSRRDDAQVAWERALKLSPDNATVLTNLAMARVTVNDAAGAESLLRRAAAQPGATLQTRQDLALVLGLQGKTAEAENLIRRNLPPELAEQNLAWLRARIAAPPASSVRSPSGDATQP